VSRSLAVLLCVAVSALAVAGCATVRYDPSSPTPALRARLDRASDRMKKTDLIQRLKTPPEIVILGGSRALRFDPGYLKKRTGLTGFNATVTGARPDDAWALVSLLHARFPKARFRFLWVIHADEFDPARLDPGLVYDPALASFFPPSLITEQARSEAAHLALDWLQRSRVFAPSGYVIHDGFDRLFPRPGTDAAGVAKNIRSSLHMYARSPARLSQLSVLYFGKTLALMQAVEAVAPVIVSAPVDPRILTALANRGWAVRQSLVLRLLASLHARYRFTFTDFSKAATCGCTAKDFFDGIHLRPSGTRKVVDAVLRRFPDAFQVTAALRSPPPDG
jgi:hypothetical protein